MKKAKKISFHLNLKKKIHLYIKNESSFTTPNYKFLFKILTQIPFLQNFKKIHISILFCQADKSRYYNNKFRNKDYATNILSFNLNIDDIFLKKDELIADLIICPQIIEKEAKEQNKTITQHYAHILIHGVLHLIGFNHTNNHDANIMEQMEIKLMKNLGYNNPYIIED